MLMVMMAILVVSLLVIIVGFLYTTLAEFRLRRRS